MQLIVTGILMDRASHRQYRGLRKHRYTHPPTDSEPTEQVDPQKSPQEGTKQYSV